jgi:hypothetical protein
VGGRWRESQQRRGGEPGHGTNDSNSQASNVVHLLLSMRGPSPVGSRKSLHPISLKGKMGAYQAIGRLAR